MSILETLKRMEGAIVSGAPHLQTVESIVEEAAPVVAAAFPAAQGMVSAVEAAVHVAEAVQHAATDTVTQVAAAAAPVAPTPIAAPLPAPVLTQTVDAASLSAAGVASEAQANSSNGPTTLLQRIEMLESVIVQVLPLIASVAKELGLD